MTKQNSKPELLAPAGGAEALDYALRFGADAVYTGGEKFGLRTRADNFDQEGLAAAVNRTHEAGKKLYVTVNAIMHQSDLEPLRSYVRTLESLGVDAVIVSDLGALSIVREEAPQLKVHVSTQASVANAAAARQWYALGARRIVLARELSLEEIAALRADVPDDLELETFVHGAMCMAYSGRCLISNYLNNRDANRGHCTQPCRWNYVLMEETRPGKYYPIVEDERGTYVMDSRDLCMIDHLDALREAGVNSFKIEGRMKGAYYVATVVNAYRRVIDGEDPAQLRAELEAVSHRPYGTGFFFGPAAQTYDDAHYIQTHDLAATVISCGEGRALVRQRNKFLLGDALEILSPSQPVRSVTVRDLRDESGALSDAANRANDHYSFACDEIIPTGAILRKAR